MREGGVERKGEGGGRKGEREEECRAYLAICVRFINSSAWKGR